MNTCKSKYQPRTPDGISVGGLVSCARPKHESGLHASDASSGAHPHVWSNHEEIKEA